MLYYMLAAHLFHQRQNTTLHVLYATRSTVFLASDITLHTTYAVTNIAKKKSVTFLSACHLPNKAATMVTMETGL
jgi:hypothetical protein